MLCHFWQQSTVQHCHSSGRHQDESRTIEYYCRIEDRYLLRFVTGYCPGRNTLHHRQPKLSNTRSLEVPLAGLKDSFSVNQVAYHSNLKLWKKTFKTLPLVGKRLTRDPGPGFSRAVKLGQTEVSWSARLANNAWAEHTRRNDKF